MQYLVVNPIFYYIKTKNLLKQYLLKIKNTRG